MRSITWLAGALTLVALAACGDNQEAKNVKREVGEAWDAVKAWGVAKRADAEKVFSEGVDDLSRTYEAAKAKARTSGGDAEKALEAKWGDVSQKLAALKAAGADKWEHARDEFVRAYEALRREVSPGP
jgi:hypothetical protein